MSIAPKLVLYNYSLASHTTITTNMTRTFPLKKKKRGGLNLQGLDKVLLASNDFFFFITNCFPFHQIFCEGSLLFSRNIFL